MASAFAWIDHSEAEQQRLLDAIHSFHQPGTRDELGLSTIRDGFADMMFPGTGSLQTRARYLFFIPWMYRQFEEAEVSSSQIARSARLFEVKLINALADSEDTAGTIGIQKKVKLKRLPSSIYWSGLKRLGIRQFTGSQADYHRSLDRIYTKRRGQTANDDGENEAGLATNWRAGFPPAPQEFPDTASLRLSSTEATYLSERIRSEHQDSIFAFFVNHMRAPADDGFVWEHQLAGQLPSALESQVIDARHFAEIMHGAAILYNVMLAEMPPEHKALSELRMTFEEWRIDINARITELRDWDRVAFWNRLSGIRVSRRTITFVNAWIDLVLKARDPRDLLTSQPAWDLIKAREWELKKGRARLRNSEARSQWKGNSGLARLEYRWRNAKNILNDMLAARGI